ncbi:hypothetical protein CB1_028233005 [Camelus ferus]|nr:hypothetical protein CB1_028233005 [Camelus ferus]
MQNMNIHTKTTSDYSGGLTSLYRTSYSLSSFQSSLGSSGDGSLSHTSFAKAVVVKKIETCNGKLVSESSDVQSK